MSPRKPDFTPSHLILAGALSLSLTLGGGAGKAAAAPATTRQVAGYANDIIRENIWSYDLCTGEAQHRNSYTYGNPSGTADEHFYCASRAAGGHNLWWRHRV
ncbi:hypothetical protein GCM10009848_28380 [Micromonospora lupini]